MFGLIKNSQASKWKLSITFFRCIKVWDMRKTYSRSISLPTPKYQLFAPKSGFSHMCIDPAGTKIYANCMDSYIYCFDVNSYQPDPSK